jgi:hypothetical protein
VCLIKCSTGEPNGLIDYTNGGGGLLAHFVCDKRGVIKGGCVVSISKGWCVLDES